MKEIVGIRFKKLGKIYFFNPNDISDIANKIIKFLQLEKDQMEKMGCFCRDFAVKNFSKQSFVKQYIKIIENE